MPVPNADICPFLGAVAASSLATTIIFLSLSADKGLPVSFNVSTPPACAELAVTVVSELVLKVTVFSVLKTN